MDHLRPRGFISTLSSESESSSVTSSPAHAPRYRLPEASLSGSLTLSESSDVHELRGLAIASLSCSTIAEDDEHLNNVTSNMVSLGMRPPITADAGFVQPAPSDGIAFHKRQAEPSLGTKSKDEVAMLDAFPFDSDKMMASSSRLGSERYDEFQMESDRMSSNRLPLGSGHHTLGASSLRSPIASSRGASTHGSGHFRAFSSDKDGINSMRSDVEREIFNEFEINNGDSMRSKDGFQLTPQQSGTLYDKVFASSRSDMLDVSAEKRILQPFIHHQLSSATMDSTKSMDTFGDFGMDVSAKSFVDSYRSDMSADTVTRRQLLDFFETTESGKSLDDSAKRMLIDYFDGNDSAKSNESVSKKELFDHFGNSEHARKMDTHTRNRFFEGFAQFHVGYPHFHISKPHVPQMPTILSAHSSFSLGSFFHHNDENHPNGHSNGSNGHHHQGFGGEGGGHGAATGPGHGSSGEYHNNILSGIWMSKQNHQMHHDEVPLHEGGTMSEKFRPSGNAAAAAATSAHDDEQPQTRHRHSSFSGVMPQLWHKKPHKSPSTLSSHPEHESHGHHSSSQSQYPMDPIQAALMSVQQQFQFTPQHHHQQPQPQPTVSSNQPTPHPSMFPQQPQQQPMTPSLYPASIGPPNASATGHQLHRAQSMMAIPTVFNFYGAANGAPGVLPPMDIKTLPRTHSAPGSTMLPHVQQFQFNAAAAAAAAGGAGGQMRLPALNHPAPVSNNAYPAHALLQQTHLSPRLPPLNAAGQPQPFHATTNSQPFAHSANGFVSSVGGGGGGGGGGGYASHLGHNGGHLGSGSNGSSLSSLTDSAATTTTITVDPISGTLKPIEILRPVVKEKPSSSAAAGSGGGGGGGHGAADKARGAYRCGKCGQPKADHVCKFVDKTFKSRGAQVYHPIFNLATNTPFPGEKFLTVRSARTSIHDTPPMMANATAVPSFTMPQHYPSGSMASGTGTPPIYSVPTIQMLRARNDLSGISDNDRHVKSEVTISVHQSMKSTLASDSTKSAHIDLSDANGGGGGDDDDEYGSFGIATGMDTGSSSKMNMMVSDEAIDGSGRFQYNGSRLNGSGDGGGDGDGGGGEGEEDDFEFCQEISSMPQKFVTNSRNSSVKASRGRAVTTLLLEEDEETDGDGSTTFDSEHTGKFTPSPSKKFQPSDSAMMGATPDFVT